MQTDNITNALDRDLVALNRMALEIIARYSSSNPEDACLKLNLPLAFMRDVSSLSSESLNHVASLGQFILQPAVEGETLRLCASLNIDQAKAHLRSATRLKHKG